MAKEPSSEPTARNYSLREELAQNRGVLRWSGSRFEQSDNGESCGAEMAERVGVKPTISIIPLEQLRLTSRSIPPEVRLESGSIPIGAIVESGTA